MLKVFTRVAAGLALVAMLTGCAHTWGSWQPVPGFVYSDVKVARAGNGDRGTKHGTGKLTSIIGWVATGDASIETICEAADIKEVTHIDVSTKSILGFWAEFTLHVYGN